MPADRLLVEHTHEGRRLGLRLHQPPGNVLDSAMLRAIARALDEHASAPQLRLITLGAEGDHFSYGASVHEHTPERVAELLAAMHDVVRKLVQAPAFTVACVRGRCLGGGLELALACDRIVASSRAELGLPEIKLGVFAPAASALLGLRVGEAQAARLLVSGHALAARNACELGLIEEVDDDPEAAALAWAEHHLFDKSAAALRFAVWAARGGRRRALAQELPELERRYLEDLMRTHDAVEGVRAFIEKRSPAFRDA
ncbi:MAG: putative enoyl-CoA hydratase [Planctomycetota bacterium]|nr:MAG: putative enoyl-CoA hydratase [Planctomycetota bacterium]